MPSKDEQGDQPMGEGGSDSDSDEVGRGAAARARKCSARRAALRRVPAADHRAPTAAPARPQTSSSEEEVEVSPADMERIMALEAALEGSPNQYDAHVEARGGRGAAGGGGGGVGGRGQARPAAGCWQRRRCAKPAAAGAGAQE